MRTLTKSIIGTCLLLPSLVMATEHNHNHNHFNPALEALGNDIISLTVCYNNGYLSEQDQDPAFTNLINYAGVDGEELGMYYMNSLGAKAEEIMKSEQGRALWTAEFCAELTTAYLNTDTLAEKKANDLEHQSHAHGAGVLSAEVIQQDVDRGRLLRVN